MDLKPRPNLSRYIEVLRRMTPEQRLRKAHEYMLTGSLGSSLQGDALRVFDVQGSALDKEYLQQ